MDDPRVVNRPQVWQRESGQEATGLKYIKKESSQEATGPKYGKERISQRFCGLPTTTKKFPDI